MAIQIIRDRPLGAPGPPNYSDDEVEWLKAIDRYRSEHRKIDLSPIEVLKVIESLGYRKVAQ